MLEIVKEEFKIAKENLIQEILKSDLSEYEKMQMIDEHNLYEVSNYIEDPFADEYEKYMLKLKDYQPITDDYFSNQDMQRGSIVKPYEYCELILDDDYDYNDGNDMITIYTNRRNDIIHQISVEEFQRMVYKWHHDNRLIGFEWDW